MIKRTRLSTITLLCGLLTFASLCHAQSEVSTINPIDKTQTSCLKTQHCTMPRAKCYSDAADAWEKDVTEIYALLLKAVPKEKRPALETSQSAWEAYRDAEFEMIAQMYNDRKGSGYISVRIILRMNVVKERALLAGIS
jgi:uncharacterized protein YecT (DUF1311 family)